MPFAETYTVIDLVSHDSRGGNTLSLLATVTTTDDLIEVEVMDTEDDIREFARITPAWINPVQGRKVVLRATMTDPDGNVLSETNGL